MRILIAEDSKINQRIAHDTLKQFDIDADILYANDGQEAVACIIDNDIDLVLLDIVMPIMTGIDVLHALKEMNKNHKPEVIMLTSVDDAVVLKTCFDLGAVDYIQKPFEKMNFIARVLSTLREISYKKEIKKNAVQLEEQNKQLKEAQFYMVQKEKLVAIGELAAGIAHEINNPLAFVSSNFLNIRQYASQIAELLTNLRQNPVMEKDEQVLAYFNDLWEKCDIEFIMEDFPDLIAETSKGLERMAKIVTSMRNFARVNDDDVYEAVDIGPLVDEVLMIVNNEIKYNSEVEVLYGDCPTLYCNKGEIEQVFVNLIVNASQANKQKHGESMGLIRIETAWEEPYVKVSICDNGVGIHSDILSKLFDPFFTTKPVGQGTGLGLSISHSIVVEKHQGKIIVESEPNMGSCFHVYLQAKAI